METEKAQGNLEEIRFVDPIDEIDNIVNYLNFITDMFPQSYGKMLNFSAKGQSGFQLMLMEIADRLEKAKDTLYQTLKDLSARGAGTS
jgi:hypothetical protein